MKMKLDFAVNFINTHTVDEVIEVLFGNGNVTVIDKDTYRLNCDGGYILAERIEGIRIFNKF